MRRWRVLSTGALILAFGLSACGSEDGPGDAGATPSERATMDGDGSTDMADDEMSDDGDDMADDEMSDGGDDMADDEMSDGGDDMADDEMSDEESMAGPEFTATTIDGEAFDGASLAGQPAVLWFWAPWCHICAGQAPAVLSVAEEHEGDVSVVGVAGLATAEEMPEFVERTETGDLTHLSDPDGEIWRMYDVAQQSTFVLLDSSGEPVGSGKFSDDELADRVAELE